MIHQKNLPELHLNHQTYYPQLDGLRAIAIILVLLEHWLSEYNPINKYFAPGEVGVKMFFVLSGFLIGTILLKEKFAYENDVKGNLKKSKKNILINFYIRRTLRIFPLYYLFLFLLLIIHFPSSIQHSFPWLFFYAANLQASIEGVSLLWPLTHFWTLAVEEQFYLIMPFIIIFTPSKNLLKTIFLFIVFGIIFRTVLSILKVDYYGWLTPSLFDTFGLGILLAYLRLKNFTIPKKVFNIGGIICFILFLIFSCKIYTFKGKNFIYTLFPFLSLSLVIIINKACDGFDGILKFFLENKIFLYIGKISYGIYVFHNVIPQFTQFCIKYFNLSIQNDSLLLVLYFIQVLIISFASYKIVEQPFNNLKKHFKY